MGSNPHARFRPPSPFRRQLPALIAAAGGIFLSIYAALTVLGWEQRTLHKGLEQIAEDRVEVLRGQLIRSMEGLHAITALYAVHQDVSRAEFRMFVAGLLQRQPEVQAFSWDARVAGPDRAAWEAKTRAEGFRDFIFTQEGPAGKLIPAVTRSEYFPSTSWNHSRRMSRPSASMSAPNRGGGRRWSGPAIPAWPRPPKPLRLAQESGSQQGFLVFQPVYGGTASTLEDRRAHLLGFAVAVFRIGDLVDSSLRAAIKNGINVSIVMKRRAAKFIASKPAAMGACRLGIPASMSRVESGSSPFSPA